MRVRGIRSNSITNKNIEGGVTKAGLPPSIGYREDQIHCNI